MGVVSMLENPPALVKLEEGLLPGIEIPHRFILPIHTFERHHLAALSLRSVELWGISAPTAKKVTSRRLFLRTRDGTRAYALIHDARGRP